MSLFVCPICGAALEREPGRYRCPAGHSYDVAREGYTHLLPANRKHSKMPGDDKGMAAARSVFLSKDYYAALRDALCRLALDYAPEHPAVLDTGCGEGYYTSAVYRALRDAGKAPCMAGTDISKAILRRAAKREKDVEFAVASSYHLPVATGPSTCCSTASPRWRWRNFGGRSGPAARFSMWCRRKSTCGS